MTLAEKILREGYLEILKHPEDMAYDYRFWNNFARETIANADAVQPIDTDKVAHNIVEAWLKDLGTHGADWDDIASLKMRISAELAHDS
jgi:hypothetical protein